MWWAIHNRTGHFGYTVDDAYIHGTISKNIAAHGSFGIIPGEFAAVSSSLLWSVLMGVIFFVTGPQLWIPGLLATLFGALTVERCNSLLKSLGVGPLTRFVVVVVALAYAPVLPILSTGMEHMLHAWTIVGLFACLLKFSRSETNLVWLFIWAALAAGARYESLFALPPIMIWLALRGKWGGVFALGFGMALPVVGFGIYSILHGGYVLPNSLMLKGNLSGAWKLKAFQVLVENQYMLVVVGFLTIATVVLLLRKKPPNAGLAWMPASVIAMILIHLQLAQLGWFYRYEGYLVILGVTVSGVLLPPLRDWARTLPVAFVLPVYVLLGFATLPLAWRASRAGGEIVRAAGNIHDQQFQMAALTRYLGEGARVGVNDLGAVSFLSDARVLDLWGLGDNKIARAKVNREFGADVLKTRIEETRTDYVICYPSWFGDDEKLPAALIPVSSWKLENNLICGSDTVVFYGTSPEAAGKLAAAMAAYRAELEPDPQSDNRISMIAPYLNSPPND